MFLFYSIFQRPVSFLVHKCSKFKVRTYEMYETLVPHRKKIIIAFAMVQSNNTRDLVIRLRNKTIFFLYS